MTLTVQEILEMAGEYGAVNDFGRTFFNDDELVDFADAILEADKKKFNDKRNAEMIEASEKRGVEW